MQQDFQICRGEVGVRPVRPFDKAYAIAFEILVKAGLEKLICMGEAIKIKVIYTYSRIFIQFDQGISWALHPAGEAHAAQQAAGQCGFAGAQVASQQDRQAPGERCGQQSAGGQRGIFVSQVQPC